MTEVAGSLDHATVEGLAKITAAIDKHPRLVEVLLKAGFSIFRPTLSSLYMAARNAEELRVGIDERDMFKSTARMQHLEMLASLGGFAAGGRVQAIAAQAYASALLLAVDSGFSSVKPPTEKHRHGGPVIHGYQFSRIVRAATNQLRHVYDWKADASGDQAKRNIEVLNAIGVKDVLADSVPVDVFMVLKGDSYFEFEQSFGEAIIEIITAKTREQVLALLKDSSEAPLVPPVPPEA
jgi:hypothetical protein